MENGQAELMPMGPAVKLEASQADHVPKILPKENEVGADLAVVKAVQQLNGLRENLREFGLNK